MQDIDVHSEFKNCEVTLLVMSRFLNLLGALRAYVDFRDSTDEFRFNLDSSVEREKDMQDIEVHSELKNRVVTLLVISEFFNLLGASRACVDFRDSTDEFRFNMS